VTTSAASLTAPRQPGRWHWPVDPRRYDTTPAVRAAEAAAIVELGAGNLRRLACHDPEARGWQEIPRLLPPLDDAGAALESPLTPHRRRAVLDATAVVLLRCAETSRSYWSWTEEEWAGLLGPDQHGFRKSAPGWADDAVRPYLAAHAFLLGGFTAFCRLGGFSRLTLAWRVFGRDRVDGEIRQVRSVLAGWGYRLGRDDDTLLPMVACQVFLLNRSPHLEELTTGLFERLRGERLLPGLRLNTLHAMQRAVAEMGFCDPPRRRTGRHSARAGGGPQAWAAWVERWHDTSTLTPPGPWQRPCDAVQGRPVGRGRASRGGRSGGLDAADLRGLDRRAGPDERRRLRPAHRRTRGPPRQAAGGAFQGSPAQRGTHILQGLPGVGVAAQALRPAARAGHPTQHRGPARGAGNNRAVSTATASSFLNCSGVRCGTGWSSAWPERVIGVCSPLAGLTAPVPFVLVGVPGPLQLRGR
jgi:hypothetical protein